MKSILVPVDEGNCRAPLRLAAEVAKHLGSVIEGIALRDLLVPNVDWGMGSAFVVEEPIADDEMMEAGARAQFAAVMHECDVPIVEIPPVAAGVAAHWNAERPVSNYVFGRLARAHALTCVPHPSGRPNAMATLETALFDSGGPIMLAPEDCRIRIGGCVVIAWNGSDETVRTLTFAMPLLGKAERVIILADESGQFAFPSGAQIQRKLAREGIEAEVQLLPEGGVLSGKTILSAAEEAGCDVLVKGAYTQSRIRQIIFGGATRDILASAEMPVFMAH